MNYRCSCCNEAQYEPPREFRAYDQTEDADVAICSKCAEAMKSEGVVTVLECSRKSFEIKEGE